MTTTLVLIPTYDEVESLPVTLARLFAAAPTVDVLVIDDASPDGTGALAESMAADDPRISVLHRPGKQGLGAAYVAGFLEGLARGYDVLVEMDADGSHPPERLPAMLDAVAAGADLVIGSRWMRGGSVVDWPLRRELLSRGANVYARAVLATHVHDMTAGYRAYRADLLRSIPLDEVRSQGYGFQIEMTLQALDAGGSVVEVPIAFREREAGVSKMSGAIIGEAFTKVAGWGAGRALARIRALLGRPERVTAPR
ncbi:polyprenol monophosphomannose synthase [Agrococcus jejuensis]|uniref:Dolichol-phosphate mannosyltransferase n=1 Tax=Agrococcus jejuensis TaxID=399736 RepID=A0A1G8FIR0_9MICO|nr:polyprenol monophosphomannose synthase [Agrococcus jejuensis]SDH81988.1 dolichol-phosphate mannosyltransferase [Agrococcus jejuensis]